MAKILVTPRSITSGGHPALDALTDAGHQLVFAVPEKQPTEDELVELLPGCAGYLAGVEAISARALEAAGQLRVISRNGTGTDAIDLEAAQRLGIRVCRAEGANVRGVAELTLGLIFALVRSIPYSDQAIKAARWERRVGSELVSRTLGVVGCGKIGRLVADMALGLGMNVIAYDPYPDTSFAPSDRFRFGTLDELVQQSDIISLHCPPSADDRPIIDADMFAKMRDGVFLVNTARGGLVDHQALQASLETGHVAGIATDVFDSGATGDDSLLRHDRLIATPHIGAFTHESIDRAVRVAVENLLTFLPK